MNQNEAKTILANLKARMEVHPEPILASRPRVLDSLRRRLEMKTRRIRRLRFCALSVGAVFLLAISSVGGTFALDSALPQGYHDYDSGNVPSWACSAGGWAMDPDSPEVDVNVRILVDGVQVLDGIPAENYREDLEQAWNDGIGGCPGGECAFEVGLWDHVTPYEAHEITVEAQDLGTGEWYPLNATPKTLTCRTYDIYVFDTKTGETRQITNLMDSHEYNPRWSPNGKSIVHDRWALDWSENRGVHITDVKTGVSAPLTGGEDGNYPTWSPNGRWIAFNRGEDLYIVPPEGGEPTLVRDNAFMASWAPNSRRLAFHQPSDGSIRTADLNGGVGVTVVESGNGPAWSPSGQWIAYEWDGDLWKVGVNMRGSPVGDPIQLTSDPAWEGRPSWSNDNRTIAYHVGYDGDTDIWTIPANGGTPTRLTGGPDFDDYDPNYSRNGRYVAYSGYMPLYPPPLHLRVNYGHDWVESFYPAEHKVWLKVTESDGKTVKATATLVTEPKDFWGGETGFQTQPEDWGPGPPDIQPNDWVFGRVDNGVSAQVQIGDISGAIDLAADSIGGTITAPWFSEEVIVECHPWGAPEPQPEMKLDTVLPNGEDTYSCSWAGEWEIQPWQDVGVGYFGPDGQWVANAFNVFLAPHFYVFPEWDYIVGWEWPAGTFVSAEVYHPGNVGDPDCEASAEMARPEWSEEAYVAEFFLWESCDIQAGDRVLLAGDLTTREHTVLPLQVTLLDTEANTIGGVTEPGTEEVHAWVHGEDATLQIVAPDADGKWTVDFSPFDLAPGRGGRAEQFDADGDATSVDWYIPNPHFTVFPEWEWFDGMDWPDGATVSISVTGKPECAAVAESWGGFFNGGFPGGCDVAVHDVVIFDDGRTTREHTVRNLSITGVDKAENTVAGTADPGAVVHVWVHEIGGDLHPTAGEDGDWLADFDDSSVDLVEGMCGRTEIRDEVGNATAVDWCVPPPAWALAQLSEDWFMGQNFTPNAEQSYDIYDGEGGTLLLSGSMQADDQGTAGVWVGDQVDLVPGNHLVISDGTTTRDLVLEALTFDVFDVTQGLLHGTAPPPHDRLVWVGIGWEDDTWTMEVTTDDDGHWTADFGTPVPDNYQWVAAQVFDLDGDASEVRPTQIITEQP
jgi:Tol biopolymer transport system component